MSAVVAAKILMIITTASAVPWGRFSTAYFVSKGISATQIGTLRLVGFFAKAFAYPIWGLISDYTQNVKFTLISSIFLCGLSLILLRSEYVLNTFALLIFIKFIRSGLNAVWPLTESMALLLIKGKGYGQTRMYCAISWGLCSFLVGYIIDRSSYGINLVFYLTWFIMFLDIIILIVFIPSPEQQPQEEEEEEEKKNMNKIVELKKEEEKKGKNANNEDNSSSNNNNKNNNNNNNNNENNIINNDGNSSFASTLSNMKIFFCNKDLQQFYFILLIYGFCFSLVESLLFIILEKEYHASKTIQGLCIFISVLFEIPVFHYSDYLLETYKVKKMFVIAHSACALRLFLYFLTPLQYPYMIVFIQLLHGFCFAVMWVAAVRYAKLNAPKTLQNTSQTFMSNVWVVGNGLGSFFWTFSYDYFQSFRICYISGCFILIGLSYYTFNYWDIVDDDERKKNNNVFLNNTNNDGYGNDMEGAVGGSRNNNNNDGVELRRRI